MPDDIFSFMMIDCAFGLKSDLTFVRLDQIPNGRLRRAVEARIFKHYNYYIRKVTGMSNLMDHSSHIIPKDNGAWSNESVANAGFDTPSPLPNLSFDLGPANSPIENLFPSQSLHSYSSFVELSDITPTIWDDTRILCTSSPSVTELTILYEDSFKENIPPSNDEISCGQKVDSPFINKNGKRPLADLSNAPARIKKQKVGRKLTFDD